MPRLVFSPLFVLFTVACAHSPSVTPYEGVRPSSPPDAGVRECPEQRLLTWFGYIDNDGGLFWGARPQIMSRKASFLPCWPHSATSNSARKIQIISL